MNQTHIKGLPEVIMCPFLGIKTIYLSLYCQYKKSGFQKNSKAYKDAREKTTHCQEAKKTDSGIAIMLELYQMKYLKSLKSLNVNSSGRCYLSPLIFNIILEVLANKTRKGIKKVYRLGRRK